MRRSSTTPLEMRNGSRNGKRISRSVIASMRSMRDPGRDISGGCRPARRQLVGGQLVSLSAAEADDLVATTEVRLERRAGHLAPHRTPVARLRVQVAGDGNANDRCVEQAIERWQ